MGLLMAFPVEGWRDSAAVDVWQGPDGVVHGEVAGTDDFETARRQAARSLSLDHDGAGWKAVGEHDPVLRALQVEYAWLRPVCFYSAYEAATSFVIGQRIAMRQACIVKDRLTAAHGDPVEIGGRSSGHSRGVPDVGQRPGAHGLATLAVHHHAQLPAGVEALARAHSVALARTPQLLGPPGLPPPVVLGQHPLPQPDG
jgi:3-methyladenine DNA glycosylase/8-oxoguanine DNA glycosylase